MTVPQAIRIALDSDFVQLVSIAAIRAALTVYGENPATAGHAARAALATRVLNAPAAYAVTLAQAAVADDVFLALTVPQGNSVALSSLETRFLAIWSAIAGA